ncbi:hypothetical protein K1T71_008239 [Dendrolimus kikuchii]|uniref:Uncharacterized protein n=1 Tax=Dendrolimus kikuchii TaxID=765133 RepID=A0ACC1CWY0_9NEOP|nr:hypothetical protein K1T71_008239 [Dendrolimus kikuchii]
MNQRILFLIIYCFTKNSDAKAITETSDEKDKVGFQYYPEIGWVHHHPMPLDWEEARLRCYYEDAELMSPENEEMLKVMSKIGKTAPIWTGVSATYSKGDFFTITGLPLTEIPINWAKDEPDNHNNNEDCLVMLPGGNMADCSCDETYAFSCYKPNNFKTPTCGSVTGYEMDHRTKSCYKFHSTPEIWSTAFMICAAEGAHLAVIDSPGEQDLLRDLYLKKRTNSDPGFVTLGFRDWKNHKLWMTVTGKNINNLPGVWAKNEPNNLGGKENCGNLSKDGGLNDGTCDYPLPFICEIENK